MPEHSNQLREVRQLRGLTLTQVAEQIGKTATTVSRYERGRQEVPDSVKIALARLYRVQVLALFPLLGEDGKAA